MNDFPIDFLNNFNNKYFNNKYRINNECMIHISFIFEIILIICIYI